MAKIEKIGNTQVIDNKEDNFFYFPMISMACTGSGYKTRGAFLTLLFFYGRINTILQRNDLSKPIDFLQ